MHVVEGVLLCMCRFMSRVSILILVFVFSVVCGEC